MKVASMTDKAAVQGLTEGCHSAALGVWGLLTVLKLHFTPSGFCAERRCCGQRCPKQKRTIPQELKILGLLTI
jgi:hypothetical protein